MVQICHQAEHTFNQLRQGERKIDPVLMDVMHQVLDALQGMFDAIRAGEDIDEPTPELLANLGAVARNEPLPDSASDPARAELAAPESVEQGDLMADTVAMQPTLEADEISDDEFERLLDSLHGDGKHGTISAPTPVAVVPAGGQSLPEAGAAPASDEISEEEFEQLLNELHGDGKSPAGTTTSSADEAPPVVQAVQKTKTHPRTLESTVRVDTGVLDRIMNMVGELVLVRNRIATLEHATADEEMAKAVGNLDVVTADLQAAVMRTRMQPIKKVFGRFPRVVRDLARGLGKEVDLVLQGEDTDLDKNLVEALADPMVHLVRNAVDHGMELPGERGSCGKTRKGTITLSAEQQGDNILLTVADDGAGMDPEVLRRKAVDNGLMDEDVAARLDDNGCYHLIFAPGFSTKQEISDVSGRGVGMDVVKTRIAQLNGSVDIESELGKGTRILIRVPLTLAIVPTLMVMLGEQIFALPLVNVKEIFDLNPRTTNVIDGQLTVVVRGKPLPLFYLSKWLITQENTDGLNTGHVVVIHIGNQMVGFVVDQLIGQEEVVIKPLGALLHGTQGLAGATITGDGRIALILDAPGLISAYGSVR